MPYIGSLLNEILNFFREGFYHVNAIQGLLIALWAVYSMKEWKQMWRQAFLATIIHVVADVLLPVIVNHVEPHLPPIIEVYFWRYVLALFFGYVVVIAAFFFVKRNVLGRSGGH